MVRGNHARVVNCKNSLYNVYIGRPSKWGNPFTHIKSDLARHRVSSREEALQKYAEWILEQEDLVKDLTELGGKVLGCHCDPYPCHGTILAELVDRLDKCEYKEVEIVMGKDTVNDIYKVMLGTPMIVEVRGSQEFRSLVREISEFIYEQRGDLKIFLSDTADVVNIVRYREID